MTNDAPPERHTYDIMLSVTVDEMATPAEAAQAGYEELLALTNPVVEVENQDTGKKKAFARQDDGSWTEYR